jgi:hypothetical protein
MRTANHRWRNNKKSATRAKDWVKSGASHERRNPINTRPRNQMSVYQKLQEARVRLQSMELKKSGRNSFAGYDYFELSDFLLPTQYIFNELGLCGVVSFTQEMATLKIVDVESGQSIEFTSPMGSANLKGCHEVQNIGAVETYQRRYLWVAAMEIVEHDALDATTTKDDDVQPEKNVHRTAPKTDKPADSEADAEIIAQMNAARDVQSLTRVMNAVPQNEKRLYTGHFYQRMNELRKAA